MNGVNLRTLITLLALAGGLFAAPLADGRAQGTASEVNQRLFDAINANALEAVKLAVDEGADVEARNAFGVTAVDLAVDLGRYEIAFYLMSFRSTDPAEGPAPPPAAAAEPAPAPGGFAGFRLTPVPREPVTRAPIGATPATAAPAPPAAPAMPANADPSGGTPDPDKGFLGFGPKTGAGPSG